MVNVAIMYCKAGEYERSKKTFFKAMPYAVDKEEKASCYVSLAETCFLMNQQDSASYYGRKGLDLLSDIKKLSNESFLVYTYNLLAEIEEQQENYKQALAYRNLTIYYNDSIYSNISDKKLSAIKEKYEYEFLLSKTKELNRKKKISFFVIATLSFIILLILYYMNKQRIGKFRMMQEYYKLKDVIHNENRLNGFSGRLDIMKEIALLDDLIDDGRREKEFKKRLKDVISKINWDTLYPMLNELHKDILETLNKEMGCLNEDEFKIVCLEYSGFHNDEIAKILRLKPNTIMAKKTKIRQKIGLENNVNIKDFLKKHYRKT